MQHGDLISDRNIKEIQQLNNSIPSGSGVFAMHGRNQALWRIYDHSYAIRNAHYILRCVKGLKIVFIFSNYISQIFGPTIGSLFMVVYGNHCVHYG